MKIENNVKNNNIPFSEIKPGHICKENKYGAICMKMDEILTDKLNHIFNAITIEDGLVVYISDEELVEPIENVKVVIE
jgi:hypothetical protein